jgi:TolB-like protein/Flp pilus assembly protein TadD
MSIQPEYCYDFGPYRLDPTWPRLMCGGRVIPLTPKALEVLLILVRGGGRLIRKEDLIREVWPDTFIEDGNLSVHIFALRKALAEHGDGQSYIETVPRRGFRLTASVRRVLDGGADEVVVVERQTRTRVHVEEVSGRGGEIDSLAVLPLANACADPGWEYFSDGVTESLINIISQAAELRVVPRATVFRYKGRDVDPQDVGRELGVRAVLTGRVCQLDDTLMIQADLIDVAREAQLWGEHYRRRMVDIFDVQEEIAREIFEKLRVRLTSEQRKRLGKRHTESPEAYEAYLKGRYYWNKRTRDGLKKSAQYFQQAVDKDPCYAPAYAGLADSYALPGIAEYGMLPPREAMPRAKAAALRALEIDGTLAEAQTTLAHVCAFYDWDWGGAEREFRRAIELNPNYAFSHHWYALYLAAMERHEEALAEELRAQEIDPLSLIINKNVGTILYYAGRVDESIERYRQALELEPNFARTRLYTGLAYVQKGMYGEAISEYREAIRVSGGDAVLEALIAHAHALSGARAEALKTVESLREQAERHYVPAFNTALIYLGLGADDSAFEWLNKAYEERSSWLVSLKVEPVFAHLRPDPRFAELMRRVGLPE